MILQRQNCIYKPQKLLFVPNACVIQKPLSQIRNHNTVIKKLSQQKGIWQQTKTQSPSDELL